MLMYLTTYISNIILSVDKTLQPQMDKLILNNCWLCYVDTSIIKQNG